MDLSPQINVRPSNLFDGWGRRIHRNFPATIFYRIQVVNLCLWVITISRTPKVSVLRPFRLAMRYFHIVEQLSTKWFAFFTNRKPACQEKQYLPDIGIWREIFLVSISPLCKWNKMRIYSQGTILYPRPIGPQWASRLVAWVCLI